MRVRSDARGRRRVRGFQPGHTLVLPLQDNENERWRINGNGAAVTDRANRTAIGAVVLRLGGSGRRRVLRRRHSRADRRHVERVGNGVGDDAKRCDRCHQLHQDRKQHDWNENFQPPSHDFPQNASGVVAPAPLIVENGWCCATRTQAVLSRTEDAGRGLQRLGLAVPAKTTPGE